MDAPFHVLLTRFNLPSGGNERYVRARDGWLRDRVALFERYCLPSVAAQTSRHFAWIIYFDPQSPDWLMAWIDGHARERAFLPIFRAEVSRQDLLGDIAMAAGPHRARTLLTTNLDNDDGLAFDFVERLQAQPDDGERTAIYLARGIIRSGHRAYLRTDRANAFCSVREPWENAVTCWSAPHNQLEEAMRKHVIEGAPGWLQVVHGANVSNRVHGKLVSPGRYASVFPRLLDDVPEPSMRDYLMDVLIETPSRILREFGRGAAKRTISALWGRDGMDRAKAAWARLRYGGIRH